MAEQARWWTGRSCNKGLILRKRTGLAGCMVDLVHTVQGCTVLGRCVVVGKYRGR